MMGNKSMVHYIAVVFISAIVISVGAVGLISYHFNRTNSINKMRDNNFLFVREQSKNILYLEELYNDIFNDIAFEPEIQKLLIDYKYNCEQKESARLQINSVLGRKFGYYENFDNIVFFSLGGNVLGTRNYIDPNVNFKSYPWAEECGNTKGESLWLPFGSDADKVTFFIAKKVYSTQSEGNIYYKSTIGEPIGYLLLSLRPEAFLELVNSLNDRDLSTICVLDKDSRIIISSDGNLVGQQFTYEKKDNDFITFNGKEYLLSLQKVNDKNNWSCIGLAEKAKILSQANLVLFMSYVICGVLVIVLLLVTIMISRMVTNPVNNLIEHFKIAETRNTSIISKSDIKEFDQLFQAFNQMVGKIYTMTDEMCIKNELQKKLEQESNENQLRALQMQINPHFLYNTLDEINWVSMKNRDESVSEMIVLLGDFLRSNIQMKGNFTTVKEEIRNVEMFFKLTKIKYGDRLDYFIDVDSSFYSNRILKLMLQPLVENSIKYGVGMTGHPEFIKIWIGREGDFLIISVRDDSSGMDDEVQRHIQDIWEHIEDKNLEIKGVGIYNIMRRLYLCYRRCCSFEVFSDGNPGVEIIISIPYEVVVEKT